MKKKIPPFPKLDELVRECISDTVFDNKEIYTARAVPGNDTLSRRYFHNVKPNEMIDVKDDDVQAFAEKRCLRVVLMRRHIKNGLRELSHVDTYDYRYNVMGTLNEKNDKTLYILQIKTRDGDEEMFEFYQLAPFFFDGIIKESAKINISKVKPEDRMIHYKAFIDYYRGLINMELEALRLLRYAFDHTGTPIHSQMFKFEVIHNKKSLQKKVRGCNGPDPEFMSKIYELNFAMPHLVALEVLKQTEDMTTELPKKSFDFSELDKYADNLYTFYQMLHTIGRISLGKVQDVLSTYLPPLAAISAKEAVDFRYDIKERLCYETLRKKLIENQEEYIGNGKVFDDPHARAMLPYTHDAGFEQRMREHVRTMYTGGVNEFVNNIKKNVNRLLRNNEYKSQQVKISRLFQGDIGTPRWFVKISVVSKSPMSFRECIKGRTGGYPVWFDGREWWKRPIGKPDNSTGQTDNVEPEQFAMPLPYYSNGEFFTVNLYKEYFHVARIRSKKKLLENALKEKKKELVLRLRDLLKNHTVTASDAEPSALTERIKQLDDRIKTVLEDIKNMEDWMKTHLENHRQKCELALHSYTNNSNSGQGNDAAATSVSSRYGQYYEFESHGVVFHLNLDRQSECTLEEVVNNTSKWTPVTKFPVWDDDKETFNQRSKVWFNPVELVYFFQDMFGQVYMMDPNQSTRWVKTRIVGFNYFLEVDPKMDAYDLKQAIADMCGISPLSFNFKQKVLGRIGDCLEFTRRAFLSYCSLTLLPKDRYWERVDDKYYRSEKIFLGPDLESDDSDGNRNDEEGNSDDEEEEDGEGFTVVRLNKKEDPRTNKYGNGNDKKPSKRRSEIEADRKKEERRSRSTLQYDDSNGEMKPVGLQRCEPDTYNGIRFLNLMSGAFNNIGVDYGSTTPTSLRERENPIVAFREAIIFQMSAMRRNKGLLVMRRKIFHPETQPNTEHTIWCNPTGKGGRNVEVYWGCNQRVDGLKIRHKTVRVKNGDGPLRILSVPDKKMLYENRIQMFNDWITNKRNGFEDPMENNNNRYFFTFGPDMVHIKFKSRYYLVQQMVCYDERLLKPTDQLKALYTDFVHKRSSSKAAWQSLEEKNIFPNDLAKRMKEEDIQGISRNGYSQELCREVDRFYDKLAASVNSIDRDICVYYNMLTAYLKQAPPIFLQDNLFELPLIPAENNTDEERANFNCIKTKEELYALLGRQQLEVRKKFWRLFQHKFGTGYAEFLSNESVIRRVLSDCPETFGSLGLYCQGSDSNKNEAEIINGYINDVISRGIENINPDLYNEDDITEALLQAADVKRLLLHA